MLLFLQMFFCVLLHRTAQRQAFLMLTLFLSALPEAPQRNMNQDDPDKVPASGC